MKANKTLVLLLGLFLLCSARPCSAQDLEVFVSGGLCGMLNDQCDIVIPAHFERIEKWNLECYRVRENGKHGLIDQQGNVVIPIGKYDTIHSVMFKRAIVEKDGLWGLIDENGNEVVPPSRLKYIRLLYGCYYFEDADGRLGFFTNNGERLYTRNGDMGRWSDKGDYYYALVNGTCYIEDQKERKTIASFPADSIGILTSDGLIGFRRGGKMGFVDAYGKEIIPPKFQWASGFYGGLCAVSNKLKNGKPVKFGFIDKTGKLVIPAKYEEVVDFPPQEEGRLTAVKYKGYWGIIDKSGSVYFSFEYSSVEKCTDVFLFLKQDSNIYSFNRETAYCYGINKTMNEVYLEYNKMSDGDSIGRSIDEFGYSIVRVSDGSYHIATKKYQMFRPGTGFTMIENPLRDPKSSVGPIMFVGTKGSGKNKKDYLLRADESIIAGPYDVIYNLSLVPDPIVGICMVRSGEKRGIIDANGRTVFPLSDYEFTHFMETRFIVHDPKTNKNGVIDLQGNFIYPMGNYRFTKIWGERIKITKGRKSGIIDVDGHVLADFVWDEIYDYSWPAREFALVKLNDRYGAIDRQGNVVIEPVYSSITAFRDGVFMVRKETTDTDIHIFNRNGKEIGSFLTDGSKVIYTTFHHGLSVVKYADGRTYTINKFGEKIFDFPEGIYPQESFCDGGYILVSNVEESDIYKSQEGCEYGIIDCLGNFIVPMNNYDFSTTGSLLDYHPLLREDLLYIRYTTGYLFNTYHKEGEKRIHEAYDLDGAIIDNSNFSLSNKSFYLMY